MVLGQTAEFLGIPCSTPYEQVLDTSKGVPWATWFTVGQTDLAAICVDRWVAETPDAEAVRWEGEDGEVRVLTYAELARQRRTPSPLLLHDRGVGRGRCRRHFLPMLRRDGGRRHGGRQARARCSSRLLRVRPRRLAVRLQDASAKARSCADGFYRRGRAGPDARHGP